MPCSLLSAEWLEPCLDNSTIRYRVERTLKSSGPAPSLSRALGLDEGTVELTVKTLLSALATGKFNSSPKSRGHGMPVRSPVVKSARRVLCEGCDVRARNSNACPRPGAGVPPRHRASGALR
eukprot:1109285-Prorocentrum_minimum.AAC.1